MKKGTSKREATHCPSGKEGTYMSVVAVGDFCATVTVIQLRSEVISFDSLPSRPAESYTYSYFLYTKGEGTPYLKLRKN